MNITAMLVILLVAGGRLSNPGGAAEKREINPVPDQLAGEFSIVQRRICVVGVTMGGHGAWDVAGRFPDRIAAAVPICGVGHDSYRNAFKEPELLPWLFTQRKSW